MANWQTALVLEGLAPPMGPETFSTSIPGMEVDQNLFQQGDVLLRLVKPEEWPAPTSLRLRPDCRLAVSSATGYSHEATCEEIKWGVPLEGVLWFDAPNGAEIRHPEHGALVLGPGKFRVWGVMETDPFAAEGESFAVRRVDD
jgi:hypothetical protein